MDLETQTKRIDNSSSVLFSGQSFLLKYDDKFGHITKFCCSFGTQNGKLVNNENITLNICLVFFKVINILNANVWKHTQHEVCNNNWYNGINI